VDFRDYLDQQINTIEFRWGSMEDRLERPPKGKKKYHKPELEVFGSVQDFTRLLGTSSHDGLTGTNLVGGAKTRKFRPPRRRE
jgi:hypothetical protein